MSVIASFPAFAEEQSVSDLLRPTRDVSNISDYFPPLETLDCRAKCDGEQPICGDFTEINSCIEDGAPAGCFWSCQ